MNDNYKGQKSSDSSTDMLLNNNTMTDVDITMSNWQHYFPEFIGSSTEMLNVLNVVNKVSKSDSSVLILGESGTGKELIASAIHRLSHRAHKRFVCTNCSAIPENLLESELFGYEKGAFTGAEKRRSGLFESANLGSLFLDEIGDMPLGLQVKILRVLQDKKYTPLGGDISRQANVRIIAATNKDLEKEHKNGNFRLDLYYRLNVLPIHIPSLRSRRKDIPALLQHFLDASNRLQHSKNITYFDESLLTALSQYSWPGNVRQLQNLVERLVVLHNGGMIDYNHLPGEIKIELENKSKTENIISNASLAPLNMSPGSTKKIQYPDSFGSLPDAGINLTKYVENLENNYILQALERTGHNKNQAAKLLGLNRTTLVERIKKRKIARINNPSKEL